MQLNNPPIHANLIACVECDLLITLPENMTGHKTIVCPRCHHKITSGHGYSVDVVLALSITALIVLFIANSFTFLSFSAQGQLVSISLFTASTELFKQGFPLLGFLVLGFVVVFPLLCLLLLVILLLPLQWPHYPSLSKVLGRLFAALLPWAMAEVFLISVLVALIKVVSMADIVLGLSFWAYILFTLLFLYISTLVDSHRLWGWIELRH